MLIEETTVRKTWLAVQGYLSIVYAVAIVGDVRSVIVLLVFRACCMVLFSWTWGLSKGFWRTWFALAFTVPMVAALI